MFGCLRACVCILSDIYSELFPFISFSIARIFFFSFASFPSVWVCRFLQASNASSLNSSIASLAVAGRPPSYNRNDNEADEGGAVLLRSESLRSLPTIRVSSPPHLPAALVRSPSRVASMANPTPAGVNRRLVVNWVRSRR